MSPHIPATTVFFFFLAFFSSASSSPINTDIHDLLPQYGLPKGILPNDVVSYSLYPDGFFTLQLPSPCYVHFDHLVFYDTVVTGKLADGSVSDVSGIQAKKLFIWLPVTGIKVHRDSDTLEFCVGALSEELPADQFQNIPRCSPRVSSLTATASLVDSI